ncbi:MAG: hypothetical protein Q9218_005688 [Villophora microphyllina]
MILGYVLENILGFLFALALYTVPGSCCELWGQHHRPYGRLRHVLIQGCDCFYDSAAFLTFSIQIASIVMLVRLDYGVSASGMGDSTAKITWAVSLLTMLPLMYVNYLPQLLHQGPENSKGQISVQLSKQRLRFGLLAVCWLLSLYPSYSKMVGYFGPSLVGNGSHQAISDSEWNIIEASCTAGVKSISKQELGAQQFFGVAGSLFIFLCSLTKIIWLGMQRQHADSKLVRRIRRYRDLVGADMSLPFLVFLPIFAISQVWTILRLRQFQSGIAQNAGNVDYDSQWTFGQIAAITVFMPVVVECWFSWTNSKDSLEKNTMK